MSKSSVLGFCEPSFSIGTGGHGLAAVISLPALPYACNADRVIETSQKAQKNSLTRPQHLQ